MNIDLNEKKQEKKPVKIITIVMVILVAFVIIFMIAYNIIIYVQISNSQKWDKVDQKDNSYYAKLVMMPEIADNIDTVYIRGFRDPGYCIETLSFSTLTELYETLPYKNDKERMASLESIEEISETHTELPVPNGIIKIYNAVDIPVTEEDSNGKVIPYYYFHENYVIQTETGFKFVFIVQTT